MFAKIHEQIFSSSIMEEDLEVRYIWLCLLTLADKEGFIDMTIPAIARRINLDEKYVTKAIERFMQPDPASRTVEKEGRRLESIRENFGWQIINYQYYRDLRNQEERREQNRLAKRRERKREDVSKCQQSSSMSANTDTDADAVSTLSGKKPDDTSLKNNFRKEAREILEFLNGKLGKIRGYQPVEVNLSMICARLKEGATAQDIRSVIAMKVREWVTDEKMAKNLRPATLFNRTKFWQYHGQLGKEGD